MVQSQKEPDQSAVNDRFFHEEYRALCLSLQIITLQSPIDFSTSFSLWIQGSGSTKKIASRTLAQQQFPN
jgi:hypothetical protein